MGFTHGDHPTGGAIAATGLDLAHVQCYYVISDVTAFIPTVYFTHPTLPLIIFTIFKLDDCHVIGHWVAYKLGKSGQLAIYNCCIYMYCKGIIYVLMLIFTNFGGLK